jgi:hypothetical protein
VSDFEELEQILSGEKVYGFFLDVRPWSDFEPDRHAEILDEYLAQVDSGFLSLGERWKSKSREEALTLLTALLHKTMAHPVEIMPVELAKHFALQLCDVAGPGGHFYSNISTEFGGMGWSPGRAETFDMGVVFVGADQIGTLWFIDED